MSATQPLRSAAEVFGVPVRARNARDRLIQKTIDLCYVHGFNAVGIDRILAEVGVTKTTFYKHFQGKDDLLAEAVKQRDAWEQQAWTRAITELGGDDPRRKLEVVFDVLDVWFNDPQFHGCVFINAAAEFPNPNDPIHEVAASHKRAWRDELRRLAAAAGAKDADTFADQFTLLMEGAMIMRHVHGRDDAAKVARSLADQLIKQWIPAKAPAPSRRGR